MRVPRKAVELWALVILASYLCVFAFRLSGRFVVGFAGGLMRGLSWGIAKGIWWGTAGGFCRMFGIRW